MKPETLSARAFREAALIEAPRALTEKLSACAEISWKNLGKQIVFYLPGMVRYGRERGRYPALSLSGRGCELQCDHCRGELLKPMIAADSPDELYRKAVALARGGALGALLTGGSDREGRIDWKPFLPAIARIKKETGLILSVHSGLLDARTARGLRAAGITQALLDVVGDDETYAEVFHLKNGADALRRTLEAIGDAGLEFIPHVVAGVHHGEIRGEYRALEIISEFQPRCVVFVVLFPFANTPMAKATPPDPYRVADLFAYARGLTPETSQSLGCERPRGADGYILEELALTGGVNRIAVQSESALQKARELGLTARFQKTCCSHHYFSDSEG